MSNDKYLHIYLNDHLAGSTAGVELAKRTYANNKGGELGVFLQDLVRGIEEDKSILEGIMRSVGARKDAVKTRAAWAAERVGRLKLNGQLKGYSPLSRVLELEGLSVAVEGKHRLWSSLRELNDPRLSSLDLEGLMARAEAQIEELERHRIDATRTALAGN